MRTKAIKIASPIYRQDAFPTISNIQKILLNQFKINPQDTSVLGSVLKKNPSSPSGDIDLAVDKRILSCVNNVKDPFMFVTQELKKISPEVKEMRSLGIVSAAIPIYTNEGPTDKFAQLDLMLVDNIHMADWFYFSPNFLDSRYKGVHRTILLSVIASYVNRKVTAHYEKTPVTWVRYFLESSGLYRGTQTILSEKTNRPTVKRRTLQKQLISDDPNKILYIILGDKAIYRDTETVERLIRFVKSEKFPYPNIVKDVIFRTKQIYKEAKLVVPKEL